MSKPSRYEQDPGKQDRLIAARATKKCTSCEETKLIADYYWLKSQNTPMSCCKDCWKASRKARWHKNTEMQEVQKEWINSNRQHIRDRENKRYREDADYRAKKKAWSKESWLKKKSLDKE